MLRLVMPVTFCQGFLYIFFQKTANFGTFHKHSFVNYVDKRSKNKYNIYNIIMSSNIIVMRYEKLSL